MGCGAARVGGQSRRGRPTTSPAPGFFYQPLAGNAQNQKGLYLVWGGGSEVTSPRPWGREANCQYGCATCPAYQCNASAGTVWRGGPGRARASLCAAQPRVPRGSKAQSLNHGGVFIVACAILVASVSLPSSSLKYCYYYDYLLTIVYYYLSII